MTKRTEISKFEIVQKGGGLNQGVALYVHSVALSVRSAGGFFEHAAVFERAMVSVTTPVLFLSVALSVGGGSLCSPLCKVGGGLL